MTKRKKRRKRRGPGPADPTNEHFRLLKEYGRHPLPKQLHTRREREALWQALCQSAKVPYIPREEVEEEWKRFVAGSSKHSALAMNADIDPEFTTVGVSHYNRLVASHTTRTKALLERMVQFFARCHPDRSAFLNSMEFLCQKVAQDTFGDS